MPTLYIIAGPNGAGKTTSSQELLPNVFDTLEFVNADNIAKGISPYNSQAVSIQAVRVMLERIKELSAHSASFVIETTLSTLSYVKFVTDCKAKGYEIVLMYVWLNSPDLAKERVKQRVSKGGHNIPEDIIERRYHKGLKNLREKFVNLCDEWLLVDNSERAYVIVAQKIAGEINIYDEDKYQLIIK